MIKNLSPVLLIGLMFLAVEQRAMANDPAAQSQPSKSYRGLKGGLEQSTVQGHQGDTIYRNTNTGSMKTNLANRAKNLANKGLDKESYLRAKGDFHRGQAVMAGRAYDDTAKAYHEKKASEADEDRNNLKASAIFTRKKSSLPKPSSPEVSGENADASSEVSSERSVSPPSSNAPPGRFLNLQDSMKKSRGSRSHSPASTTDNSSRSVSSEETSATSASE